MGLLRERGGTREKKMEIEKKKKDYEGNIR